MSGAFRPSRGRRWFTALTLVGLLAAFGLFAAPAEAASSVHVGDLNGTFTSSTATVTITVHDAAHKPVPSAYVTGEFFADGAYNSRVTCATGSFGTCLVYPTSSLPPNTSELTFTVLFISFAGTHDKAANHDPDGNSDGTTITLRRMHVGDLDGTGTKVGNGWKATVTITVHDPAEQPVVGATVEGSFSGWSGTFCTTGANGTCTVATGTISSSTSSISFTVSGGYDPAANHDPDGESNGTTITLFKP